VAAQGEVEQFKRRVVAWHVRADQRFLNITAVEPSADLLKGRAMLITQVRSRLLHCCCCCERRERWLITGSASARLLGGRARLQRPADCPKFPQHAPRDRLRDREANDRAAVPGD
jgi:hypothetical protein